MDASNPYKAPEAQLGPGLLVGEAELVDAVQPFVASRTPLLALAVLNLVFAAGTAATTLSMRTDPAARGTPVILLMSVFYVAASVMLWRMAAAMRTLAKEPTVVKITAALSKLSQTWLAALVALVLLSLAAWGQRLMAAVAVTPLLSQLGPQDPLIAVAAKLRRVLAALVVISIVVLVAGLITNFVAPPPGTAAMGVAMVRAFTVGGAVIQLGFLWLVWRQVPALDVFIAQPSGANLKRVGEAHRLIWRVIIWAIIIIAVLGFAAALAIPLYFKMGQNSFGTEH